MTEDILIGIDAGTSVMKSVAFDLGGRQLAVAAIPSNESVLAASAQVRAMSCTEPARPSAS